MWSRLLCASSQTLTLMYIQLEFERVTSFGHYKEHDH